jgi:predicted nucleic acid-binding protein
MKVLVDTSVWSQVFRRQIDKNANNALRSQLKELIEEQRAEIIGPIRQELLSGIRTSQQYLLLLEKLRAFKDLIISRADWERAAEMANICRAEGIQGSHTDFLICSVSERNHLSIFTADCDFNRYAEKLPILLFSPP